jgi:hypothetical protein
MTEICGFAREGKGGGVTQIMIFWVLTSFGVISLYRCPERFRRNILSTFSGLTSGSCGCRNLQEEKNKQLV